MAGTEAGHGMRVLIVLTSAQQRGAEVEGSQLAAELTAAGVHARAVALHAGGAGGRLLEVPVLGERPLSWRVLRRLRREAAGVDVVVAYGSTALPACALALVGRPTPFVYRSIGDPARWLRGRLHRRRTAWLFRRAAHVVALWPQAVQAIIELHGVPAGAVCCIPNARPPVVPTAAGGPERAVAQAQARAALGVPGGALVVAWVGAFSEEKRPLAAVQAVAAMQPPVGGVPPHLLLAGAGVLAAAVRDECERLLPGRHHLLGVVSLPPVWAAADVVLLTSATEGMPGVLLEAALHGVPAVATDVGAVASIVLDGSTGRLVSVGAEPAEFAVAIQGVAAGADEMGDRAAAHVAARFTWPVVVPQWQAVLGQVWDRSRNPGR